jgi:hypothetical protein
MRVLTNVLLTIVLGTSATQAEAARFIRTDLEQMLRDNETDRVYCDLARYKADLPKVDPLADAVMDHCRRTLGRDLAPRRVRVTWREGVSDAVRICNAYMAKKIRMRRGDFREIALSYSFGECVERELRR